MGKRNISIIDKLNKKNLKDTAVLLVITALIVGTITGWFSFIQDENSKIIVTVELLFVYFVIYQFSKNDLNNSIEKLKIGDTPLVLVGHSMGTLIAVRYADTYKKSVQQLILILI